MGCRPHSHPSHSALHIANLLTHLVPQSFGISSANCWDFLGDGGGVCVVVRALFLLRHKKESF